MPPKLQLIDTLQGHQDRVWNCCWSPNGKTLATCGGDKTVRLWELDTKTQKYKCVNVLSGQHNRTIRSVTWAPNGKQLACCSFDATVSIWEFREGEFECVTTLEGHENEVKSVAWDSSGNLIATCSRDKTVWIWESIGDSEYDCLSVLHGHSQDVKMVRWHPKFEHLISASYDNTIKVWCEDEDDWFCADTLKDHTSTVWAVSLNAKGTYMASAGDDKNVHIWKYFDAKTAKLKDKQFEWRSVCTISGLHKRSIYFVDWSRYGDRIATACGDNAIRVFTPDSGDKFEEEQNPKFSQSCIVEDAHSTDVNCVVWNPSDPNILASAGDDSVVKIWKYQE